MSDFKKLTVWQKSIELSLDVYSYTKDFPKEEMFVLTSQIRRCGNSIPSNIAEGTSNRSNADFKRFLNIALGSSYELETQLILANKLTYLSEEQYNLISNKLSHVQKMLQNLIKTLK
jgi:four helix bundle protein